MCLAAESTNNTYFIFGFLEIVFEENLEVCFSDLRFKYKEPIDWIEQERSDYITSKHENINNLWRVNFVFCLSKIVTKSIVYRIPLTRTFDRGSQNETFIIYICLDVH